MLAGVRSGYYANQLTLGVVKWVNELFDTLVAEHAQNLHRTMKGLGEKTMIFVLDECSALNFRLESSHAVHEGTPFDHITLLALQRIIKACEKNPFWFIMLDTTSGLQDLVPVSRDTALSERLQSDCVPLPPWHHLPFDVMVPHNVDQLPTTPLKALYLSELKVYGRPVCVEFDPEMPF